MILILSTEEFEYTTDEIIEWLNFYGAKYRRINGERLEEEGFELFLSQDNYQENVFDKHYTQFCEKRNIIFNRRWTRFTYINSMDELEDEKELTASVKTFLKMEYDDLSKHYFHKLTQKNNNVWIDHPSKIKLNKLSVLEKAVEFGLKIPDTIVTNSKKILCKFLNDNNRIITKPIGNIVGLTSSKAMFSMDTKEVTSSDIDQLPTYFYLSCFQKLILKRYELRIFFLDGDFFSMAIFSQRRKESAIDFRNYNFNEPDRMVPYKLPIEIEIKLKKLVEYLNLTTCSIDMIKNESNEYIFLEINSVGQFGMVSKPCNYFLEKKVAEFLIQKQHD